MSNRLAQQLMGGEERRRSLIKKPMIISWCLSALAIVCVAVWITGWLQDLSTYLILHFVVSILTAFLISAQSASLFLVFKRGFADETKAIVQRFHALLHCISFCLYVFV